MHVPVADNNGIGTQPVSFTRQWTCLLCKQRRWLTKHSAGLSMLTSRAGTYAAGEVAKLTAAHEAELAVKAEVLACLEAAIGAHVLLKPAALLPLAQHLRDGAPVLMDTGAAKVAAV